MRDPEGPNEGFSVDGVPVHKLDMTAGAAAMIARRAEREAEMQRKQVEARAAVEQASRPAVRPAGAAKVGTKATTGTLVPGAAAHAKSLKDKKAWRRSSVIDSLSCRRDRASLPRSRGARRSDSARRARRAMRCSRRRWRHSRRKSPGWERG